MYTHVSCDMHGLQMIFTCPPTWLFMHVSCMLHEYDMNINMIVTCMPKMNHYMDATCMCICYSTVASDVWKIQYEG